MSYALDVASMLEPDYGTVGIDIFAQNMPDTPDDCLCVYEYEGSPHHYLGQDQTSADRMFQVRVRAQDWESAQQRLTQVLGTLHALSAVTGGSGAVYDRFLAQNTPTQQALDDRNRSGATANVQALVLDGG